MLKKGLKVVSGLMAVSTLLTVAACGGNGGGNGYNPLSADQIKVVVSSRGYGVKQYEEIARAFETTHPGKKVYLEKTVASTALTSQLEANSFIGDVCMFNDNKLWQLWRSGKMVTLDDVVSAKPDGEEKSVGEKCDNDFINAYKVSDGHYYSIPWMNENIGLVYNKTALDTLLGANAWALPKTTLELYALCDRVKTAGGYGFVWESAYLSFETFIAQYSGYEEYLQNSQGYYYDEATASYKLSDNTVQCIKDTGYKIVVKLAVSQHVDYIKLFRDKNDLSDKGLVSQRFGLEPGVWYEWEIDPIAYGYYTEFKNFVISYRDIGGTILYIDEIYFTEQKFTDDLDDNVLADFDEEGYLNNVYQNVYCDPTTTRSFRTTGTTFGILDASDSSVPAANGVNASCPYLAPDGGVLKLVTSAPYGGMTYMFQEKLDLNTVTRLTFKLYFQLPILSGGVKKTTIITFGFFNQYGYDAGSVHWIDASTKFSVNEWFEFDFSAEELKEHTFDGNITGFYIQIIPNETTAEEYIYQQTLYIDEIYTTPKNSVSEQKDNVIASFSNHESLNNVAKDSLNKTAEIVWVSEKYGREGVLQVKSASRSGYSDGFRYIFDETLEVSEDTKILLPIAIEDISIKAIDVSVVGKTTAKITSFTLDDSFVKKFKTVYFTGKDIIEITNGNYVNEIAIRIQATKKSDTNVLYLDGISLYDVTKDTDKPYFDEISVQNVEVLSGETVDISLLKIPVIDDSDPDPRLSVEKLSDANGADITNEIVDGKFAPAASGNYTLTVSAIDAAGNFSEEPVDVIIAVDLYSDKADYYDALLQFNSEGSKVLVTSGSKVNFVKDTDSEGTEIKAIEATTTHTGSATTPFTINLGGEYKVSEIAGIQVTYKITSGKNGGWLGIYVNEKMSDYSADRVASITYTEVETPVYVTKTITQKDLLTKLDKTAPVTALSVIDKDNNADDRTYTIRIDSVKIIRFSEALLQFNGEESKVLITSGSNVSLVDDANATDGKAMQAKATHTSSSATPFTINLGGKYKVSEVAYIQVRYRITVGESGKIMGFYLNGINDYSTDRVASKTYSAMADYETATVTQEAMLKNGIGADAYLSTLSLIAKDYADFTICIDSITINLIKDIDYAELLKFGSTESTILIKSGSNVSLVDDDNATDGKAIQAKATHTSSSATPFTINLGGKYKVSEVASIQICYRITVGESGKIMGFYLNEINDYSTGRVASKTYSTMADYETVTIAQATMLQKNGDVYLSTLSLIAKDYADFTICIDSITINLI